MADRYDLLRRLLIAPSRPGVDGLLATADIVEDLLLLGALEDKVVFGSMNRGGLQGPASSSTRTTATWLRRWTPRAAWSTMLRFGHDDPE
jgi:hypothetical protein